MASGSENLEPSGDGASVASRNKVISDVHLETDVTGVGRATDALARTVSTPLEKVTGFLEALSSPVVACATVLADLVKESGEVALVHVRELSSRAKRRIASEVLAEQRCIDRVHESAARAAEHMQESTSPEPPDLGKLRAFQDRYKFVSDDQMVEYCGQLLAGEIVRPGCFSRTAMEILARMEPSDARLLADICPWTVADASISFIPEAGCVGWQMSMSAQLRLTELNLIAQRLDLRFNIREQSMLLRFGDRLGIVVEAGPVLGFPIAALTQSGRELSQLFDRRSPPRSMKPMLTFVQGRGRGARPVEVLGINQSRVDSRTLTLEEVEALP